MKHIKNDWIDRYLYDVVRRLPEKQRKDIEEELRTLIEDMLEEQSGSSRTEAEDIKGVLNKLGEPASLAAKYSGTGQHLIGEEYYPLYKQVVKIVLICVAAGMGISAIISIFVPMDMGSTEGAMKYIGRNLLNVVGIPQALLSAFGMVTFIFFQLERQQVKLRKDQSDWTVDHLPEIPYKKAIISRGDSIAGIVFGVLVAVAFAYAPQLLGVWITKESGETVVIPLLNQAVWGSVLPVFFLSIFAGVAEDIVKLIVGRYNYLVMWINIVVNIISTLCVIFIFKSHHIWNNSFFTDYIRNTKSDTIVSIPLNSVDHESLLTNGILSVMIVIFMVDVGVTVYRTLRYGNRTGTTA